MRHLFLFYLLACGISWLIWLPLYGPSLGIEGLPVLPYHHALGAFGPLIAATVMHYRQKSLPAFLRGFVRVGNTGYLLVATFAPFVLLMVAMPAGYFIDGTSIDLTAIGKSRDFPTFSLLGFTLYNIFTFGYGEEAGWRGYMLPVLQKKFRPLPASIILTLFWAAWHIPLFLYRPGYTGMDTGGIAGWAVSLLTGSILLTWLYNGSRQSILVCAIFHATIDVAFTSDVASSLTGYMGAFITIWGIIAAWWLHRKKPREA